MKKQIPWTLSGLLIAIAVALTARHLLAQVGADGPKPTSGADVGAAKDTKDSGADSGFGGGGEFGGGGGGGDFGGGGFSGGFGGGAAGGLRRPGVGVGLERLVDNEDLDTPNPSLSTVRRKLEVLKAGFNRARSEGDRKAAQDEIHSYLTAYFDRDMKARQAELASVKRRVDELEQLLQNRANAKKKIIQSQLETTLREAQGLGFFRENGRGVSGTPGTPSGAGVGSFGNP